MFYLLGKKLDIFFKKHLKKTLLIYHYSTANFMKKFYWLPQIINVTLQQTGNWASFFFTFLLFLREKNAAISSLIFYI